MSPRPKSLLLLVLTLLLLTPVVADAGIAPAGDADPLDDRLGVLERLLELGQNLLESVSSVFTALEGATCTGHG